MAKVPQCPRIEDLEKYTDKQLAKLEKAAEAVLAEVKLGAAQTDPLDPFVALVQAKPYFLDRVKVARFLKSEGAAK